jgi:glyoxylase-like metal-dependent hydrolase (beta-lactamase superfamily II)
VTHAFLHDAGDGITTIDTGFERDHFDAAYLVVHRGRAAFIDTGHNAAVPRLLAALDAHGLGPEAVDWVIPTHVHLDHAGGAGLLMRALPHARLLVHPRGAPHLIDPDALVAGAVRVYGEAVVAATYGDVLPVAAERVERSADGMVVNLAGRELVLLDTPGHARHHHCVWDPLSRSVFTGDTFGISYREFDGPGGLLLFPTTTPVQFEPQPLRDSVRRLAALRPRQACLTHYGPIGGDMAAHADSLCAQVDGLEALGLAVAERGLAGPAAEAALREGIAQVLLAGAARSAPGLPRERAEALLANDVQLNAQGVTVWLQRRARGLA